MNSYFITETEVELIEAQIKANIGTSLENIRTIRPDSRVTTEVPKEYFRYEDAQAYRVPAIFTIAKGFDVRNEVKGANHINGLGDIVVAVVIEDRTRDLVTTKAFRYQAALMQTLHLVSLTTQDGAVKLFLRVQNCQFSGIVDIKDEKSSGNVFRKEVSLSIQVEHIESLE